MRWQEEIGIDVLVHGEFERNDMVEYFGEQLDGFAFTENGWVQSYGSRCVKPPIIFGDVAAPEADDGRMVDLRAIADQAADEGHAHRPGDHAAMVALCATTQPRRETCRQIALALRDEVLGPGSRRHRASSRSTNRRSAKGCRCAGPIGKPISTGRWNASGSRPPASGTRRRSTPICATRSSTTSSTRSPRWMPT